MSVLLSYSTLSLNSDEINSMRVTRGMKLNSQDTMQSVEITQSGVLKATRMEIETTIRKSAGTKFTSWYDLFGGKPLDTLIILGRNWGNYHFENLEFQIDDFAPDGDVLIMKMNMSFVQNINFA
jgi:hypothetical protein